MTNEEIIQKYSLTVRCLPYEVRETITIPYKTIPKGWTEYAFKPDDIYFKTLYGDAWEHYKKKFYNLYSEGKPGIERFRKVKLGGWWLVKQTLHDSSAVIFSFNDTRTFKAPTLIGALTMFLNTLTENAVNNL